MVSLFFFFARPIGSRCDRMVVNGAEHMFYCFIFKLERLLCLGCYIDCANHFVILCVSVVLTKLMSAIRTVDIGLEMLYP